MPNGKPENRGAASPQKSAVSTSSESAGPVDKVPDIRVPKRSLESLIARSPYGRPNLPEPGGQVTKYGIDVRKHVPFLTSPILRKAKSSSQMRHATPVSGALQAWREHPNDDLEVPHKEIQRNTPTSKDAIQDTPSTNSKSSLILKSRNKDPGVNAFSQPLVNLTVNSDSEDDAFSPASPHMSPLEYSRSYYIEKAKSVLESRPCRLPRPLLQHHYAKGSRDMLFTPAIPPSVKAQINPSQAQRKVQFALPPLTTLSQSARFCDSRRTAAQQDARETSVERGRLTIPTKTGAVAPVHNLGTIELVKKKHAQLDSSSVTGTDRGHPYEPEAHSPKTPLSPFDRVITPRSRNYVREGLVVRDLSVRSSPITVDDPAKKTSESSHSGDSSPLVYEELLSPIRSTATETGENRGTVQRNHGTIEQRIPDSPGPPPDFPPPPLPGGSGLGRAQPSRQPQDPRYTLFPSLKAKVGQTEKAFVKRTYAYLKPNKLKDSESKHNANNASQVLKNQDNVPHNFGPWRRPPATDTKSLSPSTPQSIDPAGGLQHHTSSLDQSISSQVDSSSYPLPKYLCPSRAYSPRPKARNLGERIQSSEATPDFPAVCTKVSHVSFGPLLHSPKVFMY
jgi:hypothetical protein